MLTNTKIKRLRPREKLYREIDSDGLYIEVKPNGKKYWRLRIFKPKPKMMSLGEWPSVDIDMARIERDQAKAALEYGAHVFEAVARDWHAHKNYSSEKNKKLEWRRIENYLLPTLGDMRVAEIKPKHILPILKTIERSGHLELARRVRALASRVFRYAVVNLMCEHDPAGVLLGATKKPITKNMAAIVDEVGFADLLKSIDNASRLSPSVKFALQFAPFVFVRSNELREAVFDEFDFNKLLWTIPADRMKMKRDHVVPLHPAAVGFVRDAYSFSRDNYVFSGAKAGRPLSENTLNHALRSLGYDKSAVTFHGFRSSFSTLAREELRLDEDLIERQLAHSVGNSVKAAYDRSYKLEERIKMMHQWGDYLVKLKK